MDGSTLPERIGGRISAVALDADVVPPKSDANGFLPGSAESWPAAGGGLLVGMVVPGLADALPLRGTVKTLFIRIDAVGSVSVIVPYVRLQLKALHCAAALVAEELRLRPAEIVVDNAGSTARRCIADLCPDCKTSLVFLAAVARTLLVTAAAEIWHRPSGNCTLEHGRITWRRRSASYAELASDAALVRLPKVITTRRGIRIERRTEPMADGDLKVSHERRAVAITVASPDIDRPRRS